MARAVKAFMSTGGGSLREASTYCDRWPITEIARAQSHAEREVCAILAETEPVGRVPMALVGTWPAHLPYTGYSAVDVNPRFGIKRALAESLVAFIEACDQVTQDAREGGH